MARVSVHWVLFSYRLPRTPTRLRLAAWRRLKRVGAVALHGSLWILPDDAKTREHLEWLAEEIEERSGTAFLWAGVSLSSEQDRAIAEAFRAEADARYTELTAATRAIVRAVTRKRRRAAALPLMQQGLRQLGRLQRALRLERHRDYFRAGGRQPAESALRGAITQLETLLTEGSSAHDALGHAAKLPR